MRYRDCLIAWNVGGGVLVGPHPDDGWGKGYRMAIGRCSDAEGWSAIRCAMEVMLHYNTLTARDGINPAEVHREFLKIDEYKFFISRDTPGAEEGPDWFEAECAKGTTTAEWSKRYGA